MNKSALLIGAGGHAKVLVEILMQLNYNIIGVVAPKSEPENIFFSEFKLFHHDDAVLTFNPSELLLVNGIGSLPGKNARFDIYEKFIIAGYQFMTLISPTAIVSKYATLADGVQVMPGAIINAGAQIGSNSIINSGSIVEHDCTIGSHNHVAPGVTISGSVKTGNYVHIGTGANVIQSVIMGDSVMVAAGATVTRNLLEGEKLYCAKPHSVKSEYIK